MFKLLLNMKWLSTVCLPILAVGLLLSSCSSQRLYTTLDVMRPGKIAFAQDAVNVLLLNNTVSQPENYGHTTYLSGQKKQNITLNADSAGIFCLAGAAEEFAAIGFFESVTVLDESQNNTEKFFQITRQQPNAIDSLCNLYQVDVILALNRIAVSDVISDYYLEEDYTSLAALDVKTVTNWSVHYPHATECESINLMDSLFWEETNDDIKQALQQLPNRADAVVDASIYAGKRTCERLLPRWEQVDRYFYTSRNKLITQGIDSVYHKSWDAALAIWEQALEKSNLFTQGIAYANMAVASEIIGDIDKAIDYTNSAMLMFSISFNMNSYEYAYQQSVYLEDLVNRKKELEQLKKQL